MRSCVFTIGAVLTLVFIPDPGRLASAQESLTLENGLARFSFDARSGALTEIHLADPDHTLTLPPDAAAPVRIWLGTPDNPEVAAAVVSQAHPSLSSHRTFSYDGGRGLELCWNDLLDGDGNPTGVSLTLTGRLDDDTSFLRLRTALTNRGPHLVTGLFLGLEDVKIHEDPAQETLSVPRYLGWQESEPRTRLRDQKHLLTVPPTVPSGLYCVWSDLSGESVGFGTGYLNRKDMDMLGRVTFRESGGALGWQLFRLEDTWRFMKPYKGEFQVYPLQRGEDFTSDEWFLGLHAGDWHPTAEYYRSRYEVAFAGDFLPWHAQPASVRGLDVVINSMIAWGFKPEDSDKHDLNRGVLHARFLEIPDKVRNKVDALGVDPARCVLVQVGQGTHWGIYKFPDYFPPCVQAGSPEDFREMIRQLREDIGLSGTHFYAHAVFNHPDADHYVPEADTGYTENLLANHDHLGRVACLDCEPWQQFWRESLLPDYAASGATGIYFDEGFGHHLICDQPGHGHGLSAESVLTAQNRGLQRIYREWRRIQGPEAYLACESGSDSAARLINLWEGSPAGPVEIVRFTHPDKIIVGQASQPEHVARCFVYGMPLYDHVRDEGARPEAVTFVRLRQALRDEAAPGYPQGFRDSLGVVSAPPNVVVKTYRDDAGITVCYYAREEATGEIVLDGTALDHPELGSRTVPLSLKPMEFGYAVLRPE